MNILALRREAGMSRKVLAIEMFMNHQVRQSWSEVKIAELEHTRKGRKRNISADDLVAVAHSLDIELWRLFVPPATFDGGKILRRIGNQSVDVYSYRLFGMKAADVRAAVEDGTVKWPKQDVPMAHIREILKRHPRVVELRRLWWDEPQPDGSAPTTEGLDAEVERILIELKGDWLERELFEIPIDRFVDLDPSRNYTPFAQEADDFWAEVIKDQGAN